MKRVPFAFVLPVLVAVGALSGCAGQTRSRVNIDPRADEALHKMSAALGRARSFSFQSTALMDEPTATGHLAQFSRETRMVVRRPDRVFVESHEGDDVWLLWYHGTSLTLLDKTGNTYASEQVPGRIDEMLDDAAKQHGLTLPLADLLFADPYKALTGDAHAGRYVGLFDLDGVKCHHLLFTQEELDWQIWIDAAKEAVPRKIVIDYKGLRERPQFTALLTDWNLSAPAEDGQFEPDLPNGAKQVKLTTLLTEEQGG